MTERGTPAGDASRSKTRYHLLTTDGGIVADQPGKMAGEAAIGVVLKAPLEEISEPIGPAKDHHDKWHFVVGPAVTVAGQGS